MNELYNKNFEFWNSYKHDMQNTGAIFPIQINTDVNELNNIVISDFVLLQNYPNPLNPSTKIQYQIPEINFVTLMVYDVLGNEIATLVNEEKPPGSYKVEFNAEGLTSGIYFYQLSAGNFIKTKKMILLK